MAPESGPRQPHGHPVLPTDPDVDLHTEPLPTGPVRLPWPVLAAIAAGGVLGALARYGLAVAWPSRPGHFPWATFATNVSGCLLIGVLMVLITEVRAAHPLVRPLLGVGVLGGFTTFSTYAVDVQRLVAARAPGTALLYLAGTLVAALLAAYAGIAGTRAVAGVREGTAVDAGGAAVAAVPDAGGGR